MTVNGTERQKSIILIAILITFSKIKLTIALSLSIVFTSFMSSRI